MVNYTHADRRCLEYLVHFAKRKGKGIFRALPDIYTALGVDAEKNQEVLLISKKT